jgi:hypothetical protein
MLASVFTAYTACVWRVESHHEAFVQTKDQRLNLISLAVLRFVAASVILFMSSIADAAIDPAVAVSTEAIYSGLPWRDTAGELVNAHGIRFL